MRRGLDGISLLFGSRAVFKPHRGLVPPFFGGHSEGETPLPIPNRAVKPLRADGTWPSRAWESRSPPNFLHCQRAVLWAARSSFWWRLPAGAGGGPFAAHAFATTPGAPRARRACVLPTIANPT